MHLQCLYVLMNWLVPEFLCLMNACYNRNISLYFFILCQNTFSDVKTNFYFVQIVSLNLSTVIMAEVLYFIALHPYPSPGSNTLRVVIVI